MAESYNSFQGRQPDIDVNLFVSALTQGIAAGNAQKTRSESVIGGIEDGVKNVLDVGGKVVGLVAGVQGIQTASAALAAQEAANAVTHNADGSVNENVVGSKRADLAATAKLRGADAALHQAQADAIGAEGGLAAKTKTAELREKYASATQKSDDIDSFRTLIDAFSPQSTLSRQQRDELVQDQKVQGLLYRSDDQQTQKLLATIKGGAETGMISSDVAANTNKSFNAVLENKRVERTQQRDADAIQAQAIKTNEQYKESVVKLRAGNPALSDIMDNGVNGEKYDGNKLDVVPLGGIELGADGAPIIDANGKTIPSTTVTSDKRYAAVYNGKIVSTYDENTGKELAKGMGHYKLGYTATRGTVQADIQNTDTGTPATQAERLGLASKSVSRALDTILPADPVNGPVKAVLPDSALQGKSPAEQLDMKQRFENRISKLGGVPREYREVVDKVNANPVLANERSIIKALASAESGGNNDAKSPFYTDTDGNKRGGVSGVMQMTQGTFDGLREKYPNLLKAEDKNTPEGQVVSAKILMLDLMNQFHDLPLAVAAYNAGGPAIQKAMDATPGVKNWETIQPALRKVLGAKYEETSQYTPRVLKYYQIYG